MILYTRSDRRRRMKPWNIYPFGLIVVMGVFFSFMGCTHNIRSSDIPALQTGSPLKGIKPMTFAFKEFSDIRGTDPFWVGKLAAHEHKMDQPVARVVAMAIKKELERNGHICINYSMQAKADFNIEGTVFKYGISMRRVGGFHNELAGNVAVKLTIINTSTEKSVFIKNYSGDSLIEAGGFTAVGEAPLVTLSQAQSAMVKKISIDTELIAFLEK